jgi:predicted enzyme related to lactoylglutathione lyase/DNA-binding transcriptional ArsR family regulator
MANARASQRRDPDATYRAVSDGTRRRIIDLLARRGPLRAGDIAEQFSDISRPAVSRHLRVLREARLLRGETRGREHWLSVNPLPLKEVQDWVNYYQQFWSDQLDAWPAWSSRAAWLCVQQQEKRSNTMSTQAQTQVSSICHIEWQCKDHARTQEFYSKLLGWQFRPGHGNLILFGAGDKQHIGGFAQVEQPQAALSPTPYWVVPSLDDLLGRVKTLGGCIIEARHPVENVGFAAVLGDPDSNRIGIVEFTE